MQRIKFDQFIIKKMPELKIEDIGGAYTGKPNTCLCGCAGVYVYPKVNQEKAGKRRGYEVTDDEVNDKRVMKVLDNFIQAGKRGEEIEVLEHGEEYIFTIVVGKTQYTLYTI